MKYEELSINESDVGVIQEPEVLKYLTSSGLTRVLIENSNFDLQGAVEFFHRHGIDDLTPGNKYIPTSLFALPMISGIV